MVHDKYLLTKIVVSSVDKSKTNLSISEQVSISNIGKFPLFNNRTIQNIVHIPYFKYNYY